MSDTTSVSPRRWPRYLAWAGGILLAIAVLVAGLAYFGVRYLASEEIKRFEGVIGLNGGSVAFRSLRIDGWDSYPLVDVTLTDFVVEERDSAGAPMLAVDSLHVPLHVDFWDRRRATLLGLTLRGGGFHVRKDSAGTTNLGRLLGATSDDGAGDAPAEGQATHDAAAASYLHLDPEATFLIEDFDVSYVADGKGTDIGGRLRSLRVDDFAREPGFSADFRLDAHMDGLQLKASEGAYLRDGDVYGAFGLRIDDRVLTAACDSLRLGPNVVTLDARMYLDRADTSVIRLAMPESRVADAREILSPHIRDAIASFDVEGVFSSVTAIKSTFAPGDQAVVEIDLALRGNTARVDDERFRKTYLNARFVNLPADTTGGKRGVQFFVDTVRTDYFGFDIRAARAVVRADLGEAPRLIAKGELRGPASAVSDAVAGKDFVFTRGRVLATASVDGDPNDVLALMNGAILRAEITDAAIDVPAAGVTLPYRSIRLDKGLDTTHFELAGELPAAEREYRMEGHLMGIGWLLGTDPGATVETDVRFTAPCLAWTDLVDALGAGGMELPADPLAVAPGAETPPTDTAAVVAGAGQGEDEKAGFKSALRLVQRTFHPTLELAIDTLRYYDLDVTAFRTGMHFASEHEVVLERTTFRLDSAALMVAARLDIGPGRLTDFALDLEATRLDLGAVAAEMDYFGVEFLAEVPRLPDDVDLVIRQRGKLDAAEGIVPALAEGVIDLESNGALPFSARAEFEPDRPGVTDVQTTRVALQGSPELFNSFFATEDFFFRGGDFDFRMGYGGVVPGLRQLIDENRMQLRVTDATVDYRSAGIRVPFEHLDLEMHADTAAFDFRIEDARFGQEITLAGHANNVSEVVLGDSGKDFSCDVVVASPRLVWRDINRLIGKLGAEDTVALAAVPDTPSSLRQGGAAFAKTRPATAVLTGASGTPDTGTPDTATPDTGQLHLRRTLKEVFTRFRPRATVHFGELQLTNAFAIRDVNSTVYLGDDEVLYIDTTGFDYRDGYLDMAGKLDLSDLTLTPFHVVLGSDRLEIASLLEGLEYLNTPSLAEVDQLDGEMSLRLDLSGAVTGGDSVATVFSEATCGTLDFQLRDLVLSGLTPLDDIAASIKMRKRLNVIRMQPVDVRLRFDGSEVYLARTELQSNAFNAFVEGAIRLDSASSVLVSVPLLPNLRRDLETVPEKEGYEERSLKVHLELTSEPGGEGMATKFRFRRKPWARRVHGE